MLSKIDFHLDAQMNRTEYYGIPWNFKNSTSVHNQWIKKIQDVLDFHLQKCQQLERAILEKNLIPSTQKRLQQLLLGHQASHLWIKNQWGHFLRPNENHEIVALERVPRQQSATAYQETLFRDWVWGRDQIESYFEIVAPYITSDKSALFLGAGACGLPILIHEKMKIERSLAVDINPLLLIPIKKMLSGENQEWIELPHFPRSQTCVFNRHQIPAKKVTGFEFLFSDFQNLKVLQPLTKNLFTFWSIDIIPLRFKDLCKRVSQFIPIGGRWHNIGQLGFQNLDPIHNHTQEEIRDLLKLNGFEILMEKDHRVPYLQSPFDRLGRADLAYAFCAQKIRDISPPPDFDFLPHWILDETAVIPRLEEMNNLRVRLQVYDLVLSFIDGNSSLQQVSQNVAKSTGLSESEAVESVRNFLIQFYEGQILREF